MNIPPAAVRAASAVRVLENHTGRRIPAALVLYDDEIAAMLTAALPHLLPGLYVTRHDGDLTVWRTDPDSLLGDHALTPAEAYEALAGMLPDRTTWADELAGDDAPDPDEDAALLQRVTATPGLGMHVNGLRSALRQGSPLGLAAFGRSLHAAYVGLGGDADEADTIVAAVERAIRAELAGGE